jgi:hypothetical protein
MDKRSAKHVTPRLAPSETVHLLVRGRDSRHKGSLVLTDQRVLFVSDRGSGPPVFDFHLSSVSSIDVEGEAAKVQIVIHSLGVVVQVDAVRREEAEAFIEETRSAVAGARFPVVPAQAPWVPARSARSAPEPTAAPATEHQEPTPQAPADPSAAAAAAADPSGRLVAALRELAELHRSGVLDDYEFAMAKAKLLT